MASYQIRFCGKDGKQFAVTDFTALDDASALAHAREVELSRTQYFELWHADRQIYQGKPAGESDSASSKQERGAVRARSNGVLVVDDDSGVRDLLVQVMRDAGYRVDAASKAADALSYLQSRTYALVVTDAKLPDGSGVAIADNAKARGVTAIILTGYAAETRPGGPQHNYLFKPIRPEELLRAVSIYIGPPPRS